VGSPDPVLSPLWISSPRALSKASTLLSMYLSVCTTLVMRCPVIPEIAGFEDARGAGDQLFIDFRRAVAAIAEMESHTSIILLVASSVAPTTASSSSVA